MERPRSSGLVEILDRVLDKGLVVAGDIKVSLADVELLTIRIRLIVCSIDKAQEIGLDWWKHDRNLTTSNASVSNRTLDENAQLKKQIAQLKRRLDALSEPKRLPPKGRPTKRVGHEK